MGIGQHVALAGIHDQPGTDALLPPPLHGLGEGNIHGLQKAAKVGILEEGVILDGDARLHGDVYHRRGDLPQQGSQGGIAAGAPGHFGEFLATAGTTRGGAGQGRAGDQRYRHRQQGKDPGKQGLTSGHGEFRVSQHLDPGQ